MCLAPAIIDERITHIDTLLGAARQLIDANAETGEQTFSGAIAVLQEIECRLNDFGIELKANCQPEKA
jgi:hypothetical protein